MKKFSLVVGVLFSFVFLAITQHCSSNKSDPQPAVVPPNTELNSLFDAVFLASKGFQDLAKTQPNANDKEVLVISDLRGDKELTFTTNRSDPKYVKSPIWTTAPKFYTDDAGGYILVPNVSETFWSSKPFTEIPQPYDVYVVLRDFECVAFEGYFASGIGLRNRNDHLEMKVDSRGITTSVDMANNSGVPAFNKRTIVRMRMDGANSSLWLNNVQVPPNTVNLGNGAISVIGYGTNSHAAQHDFYGMWIKFGTLSSDQHKFIYDELAKQYNPGNFPDKPIASKIKIVGNAAASPREWSVTYDFIAPNGATEDKTKTEYRWGYLRSDANQDLNSANYLSGPNGTKSTLKRSDFSNELIGPLAGKVRNLLWVEVKVYDTNGNSFNHIVRSALVGDEY
jgi:hypothetical protein